jgi:MFS family permease
MTSTGTDQDPGEFEDESDSTKPKITYGSNENGIDLEYEKKLIRKIDWHLLPILGVLYSVSLIDRTNVSGGSISGMIGDLHLNIGSRYSIVLLMFFVPCLLFELPSNILLRRVGAAKWLGTIALLWGGVMIGMGFVRDWRALVVCRTILGFFEAGFFPGCLYLISSWYVRYEVQQRLAGFYLMSVLIGGLSSIFAYGLMQLDGTHGLSGWRWIFIIEGTITCGVALGAYAIIIDFPDKVLQLKRGSFLTANDIELVNARIDRDRDDSQVDPLTMRKALKHLSDWKLWAYSLIFMGATIPAYAFTFFMGIILTSMGYSGGKAQILAAPPYVASVVVAAALSWGADKTHLRAPFIVAGCLLVITGLSITAYHPNNAIRYLGIFIGLAGANSNIPTVLAYQANNIRTASKRSIGSALQVSFGSIGGIYASTVFREKDSPRYLNGMWATIGAQFLMLVLLATTSIYFKRKNRQHAEGTLREPIEGHEDFTYTL